MRQQLPLLQPLERVPYVLYVVDVVFRNAKRDNGELRIGHEPVSPFLPTDFSNNNPPTYATCVFNAEDRENV